MMGSVSPRARSVSAAVSESQLGSNFLVVATVKDGVDPARVEAIVDEELETLLAWEIGNAEATAEVQETHRCRRVFGQAQGQLIGLLLRLADRLSIGCVVLAALTR